MKRCVALAVSCAMSCKIFPGWQGEIGTLQKNKQTKKNLVRKILPGDLDREEDPTRYTTFLNVQGGYGFMARTWSDQKTFYAIAACTTHTY